MEMSFRLIKMRIGEIETKLKLLGIETDTITIESGPSYSPDFTIRIWTGYDYIHLDDDNFYMSISEFANWYKHMQILLRKF